MYEHLGHALLGLKTAWPTLKIIAYHSLSLGIRAKVYSLCLSTMVYWNKLSKLSLDFIESFVYLTININP